MQNRFVAAFFAASVASIASAGDWGLLYEFSTDGGSSWSRNVMVDVTSVPATVAFRMSAYVQAGTTVTTAAGTGLALTVGRFTGSNILTNFGSAGAGDQVLTYVRNLPQGNASLLQSSLLTGGAGRVLGVANSLLSFAGQLLNSPPSSQILSTVILSGTIRVGNNANGYSNPMRTITFQNYTYGMGITAPGNTPGLTFYNGAASNGQTGVANGEREDLAGAITVIPTPASVALIALGGLFATRRRRA